MVRLLKWGVPLAVLVLGTMASAIGVIVHNPTYCPIYSSPTVGCVPRPDAGATPVDAGAPAAKPTLG
jgi:hypothetical protein